MRKTRRSEIRIYVITEQSEIGAWEPTGEGFAREGAADDRVDELTQKKLASYAAPFQLCKLLGLDEEAIDAMSEAKRLKAIKAADKDHVSDVVEEVQCGSMYSYDVIDVKDAKWVK